VVSSFLRVPVTVAIIYAAANLRLVGTYRRKLAGAHTARPDDSILFEQWRSQMRRERRTGRHPLAPRRESVGTERHRQLTAAGVAVLIRDTGAGG
jgi:hypothetical protein